MARAAFDVHWVCQSEVFFRSSGVAGVTSTGTVVERSLFQTYRSISLPPYVLSIPHQKRINKRTSLYFKGGAPYEGRNYERASVLPAYAADGRAKYLPYADAPLVVFQSALTSLGAIITHANENYAQFGDEIQTYIDTLNEICEQHPEFKSAELKNASWDNEEQFPPEGFRACVFQRGNELNVCYRGTPEGAWVDNGKGMTGVVDAEYLEKYVCNGVEVSVSPMQLCAIEYMQDVINSNDENLPISISGHSKGGNEAQLAAVIFGEYVDAAYSFDGQGFPPEVVEQMKKIPGWDEAINKILGIHADNDFVHGLGEQIIPSDKTVYLQTPETSEELGDFIKNHFITAIVQDGNLTSRGFECSATRFLRNADKINKKNSPRSKK